MNNISNIPDSKFANIFQQMNLNPFTLSFKGETEKEFRKDYYYSSIVLLRASFLLGIVYYAAFSFLDAAVLPEIKSQLFMIRFLFVCPVLLIVFLLSYLKSFEKWWHLAASIAIIVAGLGIIIMVIITTSPGNITYYTGLILVLIYCYLLIKLRFIWAAITGWSIVLFYGIAVYLFSDVPTDILIANNFFLVSANILGMFGNYYLEFYTRKDFYLRQLLNNEQQKVVSINQELELRVTDRTEKLEKEIEERKEVEKKLLKEKAFSTTLIQASPVFFVAIDEDGKIIMMNNSMHTALCYTNDEVVGKNFLSIFISEEDHERLSQAFKGLIQNHKEQVNEIRILKKDGKILFVEWHGKSILDEQGNIDFFFGTGIDITQRKQAEGELKKHRQHLEELVKERTAELEEKNEKLEYFNKLFVGREFRIKELRDKVKELEEKISE